MIGAGPAGLEAARSLAGLGHPVTVIDRSAAAAGAAAAGAKVPGIDVLPSTTLAGFDGFPGSFTARLQGPAGIEERAFGAVIVATGLELADPARRPFVPGKIVPLPSLSAHLAGLRLRELPKSLAIVLDLEIDEGRASCDAAYRLALEALRKHRAAVTLLVRDAKVASLPLNQAYDDAREAGVTVLKYTGAPVVRNRTHRRERGHDRGARLDHRRGREAFVRSRRGQPLGPALARGREARRGARARPRRAVPVPGQLQPAPPRGDQPAGRLRGRRLPRRDVAARGAARRARGGPRGARRCSPRGRCPSTPRTPWWTGTSACCA